MNNRILQETDIPERKWTKKKIALALIVTFGIFSIFQPELAKQFMAMIWNIIY